MEADLKAEAGLKSRIQKSGVRIQNGNGRKLASVSLFF
jgi:hypothetical protein